MRNQLTTPYVHQCRLMDAVLCQFPPPPTLRISPSHPSSYHSGHAVTQAVSRRIPTAAVHDLTWSCGICGERSDTGAGLLACKFSFHRLLHIHHHHLSPGARTIGQLVVNVPSGLCLTPHVKENLLRRLVAGVPCRSFVRSYGISGE
jgi:hypothetical protein